MIRTNKQAAIGPDNNLWSESLLTYIRKNLAKRNDISLCTESRLRYIRKNLAIDSDISLCRRALVCSGPDFSRDSAGGAEERSAPQPEGIDGPRRARRQLSLLPLVSTIALMKALHQKITGYSGANGVYHPYLPPEQLLDYAPCFGTCSISSGLKAFKGY